MGRVVKDDVIYEDGLHHDGFCPSCKVFANFPGVVRLTGAGRVVASGPCPNCGTTMTRRLA